MLLAGPILRRVDAQSVNVWIALDENIPVSLSVNERLTNFDDKNPVKIEGDSTELTHNIGSKLVVKLITFKPTTALQTDKVYSYYLKQGDISILKDLVDVEDSKMPLGYSRKQLPSFVLPSNDIKDLIVAHGSCRKMHGDGREALSNLDGIVKDNIKETKKRLQQLFLTGDQLYADEIPRFGLWSITEKAKELINDKEDLPLPKVTVDNIERPAKRISPSDALPGLRHPLLTTYAKMTTGSGESHLLTFGEFCSGYLHAWSPDVWKDELKNAAKKMGESPTLTTTDANWDVFKTKTNFTKAIIDSRDFLTPEGEEDRAQIKDDFPLFEKRQKFALAAELREVANFLETLPKVRRIMANTPTYMIFDDHEITDDWNISMKWKNEVYGNSLGKTVVRNGLMAYALFQDLGNEPAEYKKADSKKALFVEQIKNYSKASNFSTFSTENIDKDLGITNSDAQPELKWHYLISSGDKVKTLFLDTRNRRHFNTLHSRPGLLDTNAFEEQFKFPTAPQADEVLFVVSACPAIGLSVFEELVYPLYSSGESSKKGLLEGQIVRDNEAWYLNSEAFEELLKRMSVFKKVVLFSGDIHYGFTTYMDYWTSGNVPTSRFIQLVSSPIKNLWKKNLRLFQSGFTQGLFMGFGGKVEKFGWKDSPSVSSTQITLVNRRRLREKPAVIDNFGWQPNATVSPSPEWRYRLQVAMDTRDDKDFSITDTFDHTKNEDLKKMIDRYHKDYKLTKSRRFVFATHICKVHFEGDVLKHTFLYQSPEGKLVETVHDIPLTIPDTEKSPPELSKTT